MTTAREPGSGGRGRGRGRRQGQDSNNKTTDNAQRYQRYRRKAKGGIQGVWQYFSTKANLCLWGIALIVIGGLIATEWGWLGDLIGWAGIVALSVSLYRLLRSVFSSTWVMVSAIATIFLFVVLGVLFFQSAHIYATAGRAIAPESGLIDIQGMGSSFVGNIPILGWAVKLALGGLARAVRSLELTMFALLGVMAYAIIQSGEVMPVVIRSSPETLEKLIKALQQFKMIEADRGSSDVVHSLVEDHNSYYESLLWGLDRWRIVCYAIDFVVCAWFAPWVIGGWGSYDSLEPFWGQIWWANVIRVSISLFFFEWVVRKWIDVRKGYYLFTGGAKASE